MTAVAAPPAFSQLNKQTWGTNGNGAGNPNSSMTSSNSEDLRLFPRKSLQRSNSSSSISSTASASSITTVATNGSSIGTPPSSTGEPVPLSINTPNAFKKRSQQSKPSWLNGRSDTPDPSNSIATSITAPKQIARAIGQNIGTGHQQMIPSVNGQVAQGNGRVNGSSPGNNSGAGSAANVEQNGAGQVLLYLSSLNGTFERKSIHVPFSPDVLRIGRQTNQKTAPTAVNGYFDSKVLSRQHAEIWADRNGKIWIRDVKSSNGTFVNGTRLSAENRESEPHEVQTGDHLELGIDIIGEDGKTVIHHKVSAKVEHAGPASANNSLVDFGFNELDPTNNNVMLGGTPSLQGRARNGSNPGMAPNSRVMPGSSMTAPPAISQDYRRPFMVTPVTTENIIKKLQNEIRGARLQSKDIGRSEDFVNILMTKDILAPAEPALKPIVNGYHSFRADPKSRFSDPPAPPPQQPLPEKPTDVPSLKKSFSDRPKSHPVLPPREPSGQVLQMQNELETYKRSMEEQENRLKVLEETLLSEREARQAADELNQHLEQVVSAQHLNSMVRAAENVADVQVKEQEKEASIEEATSKLQAQIDTMQREMLSMQQQVEMWKQRFEKADAARSIASKHLAEMVLRIREESEARGRGKPRSKVRGARTASSSSSDSSSNSSSSRKAMRMKEKPAVVKTEESTSSSSEDESSSDEKQQVVQKTSVCAKHGVESKQITNGSVTAVSVDGDASSSSSQQQRQRAEMLFKSLPPYASIVGVVILGMGMMAFINGWQPQPRVEH